MEKDQKCLPSEKLQKEFEDNPMKILEILRNEKESQIDKSEEPKREENSTNSSSEEKSPDYNKAKNKEESTKEDNFSKTFDFLKNEKHAQNDFYIKNNINDANYNVNNINKVNSINKRNYKNSFINYVSNINYDNNITLNNLSIVFTFNNRIDNNNDNAKYINKNTTNKEQCINNNNNVSPKNNSEEANSTSSQSNEDEKNINNINNYNNKYNYIYNNNCNIMSQTGIDNKILFLSNINAILENLKTFKGSIICQEFIDNIDNEKECSILFNNITPHICTIMCLEYGNYFFQKLLKKLNLEQKLIIYKIIEPNFYNIASNKFGTHSIQSLINNIQSPYELYSLYKLISQNMYVLFVDSNAYHIMMKIILDFPEEQRNPLNLFLVMNAEKIIINCNGAFCINKFITHNKDLNLRALLINNLQKNIKELIYNKFSCINLLLILETFGINWGKFIINEIQENFGVLCEHPVSNIFISKVLYFLNNNYSLELKVLLWSLYKNIVLMKNLISNKNNNNIIKQLLDFSDDEQKKYLFLLLNSKGNI